MAQAQALERTPLYACHVEAGARLVDFAGWEMPVQYTGVLAEHRAVRSQAGLFDVSHMGEIVVMGPEAERFVESLTPGSVADLAPGRAQYSALLTEAGTYVDDLLIYRYGHGFMLVVNASNAATDLAWIESRAIEGVRILDRSADLGLLALQGPASESILSSVCDGAPADLSSYDFIETEVCGVQATVSRTGYTGEDGFEVYVPATGAAEVWHGLLEEGGGEGLVPCGLAARDTLRLEAGLSLYGHEIDRTVNPFEVRLGWTTRLDGVDFVGRDALVACRAEGLNRRLVGLELRGRRIARQGAVVFADGTEVGRVTSGTFSPTLEKPIAMALVGLEAARPETALEVEIRGHREPAKVTRLPFYKRRSAESPPQ